MNDIKKTILEKIQSGDVAMRPKWYYVLKSVLLFTGVAIIGVWIVYLVSFVLFAVLNSGAIFVPAFGLRGLTVFLLALPWLMILLAAVFIIVLEVLVRKYSFGYRKPLLYTVLMILGVATLGTVLVAQTNLHERALERATGHRLPVVGDVYRIYHQVNHDNVHAGVVTEVSEGGFVMLDRLDKKYTVVIMEYTKIPPQLSFIKGNQVVVLGEEKDGVIEAEGIKVVGRRMKQLPPGEIEGVRIERLPVR